VRIPAKVAREVDRLARGVHRRTAWAHHPLCERYGGETFRLGRHLVCRGCALAASGAVAGLGAVLALGPAPGTAALACGLLALPALLALAVRVPKVLGRTLPGASVGAAAGAVASTPGAAPAALAAVLALAVLVHVRVYRRRGPDRSACETCPERALLPGCAGFAPLLRRERAFQRAADRLIAVGSPASTRSSA
jgi:hypothetical protein